MIVEAVQPPKEMLPKEIQDVVLKFPELDVPSISFELQPPTVREIEFAQTAVLEALGSVKEELPEDSYVQRHQREADNKPELGGLIW